MSIRAPLSVALLFALVLSSLSFSAQTPLQKFLNDSFEPDQAVATQALSAPGGYLLITAGGVETYVVSSGTGVPVSDRARLESILVADMQARSAFDERQSSASAFPKNVTDAKKKDEAQCMLLTGTDMHTCTDKATCIYACKSNPNCDIILYSDGFWEALLDWSVKRTAFDSKLAEYSRGIDAIKFNQSLVDSKVQVLDSMAALAQNMSKNTIFLNRSDDECKIAGSRCFEYCKKIDYSQLAISSQKQNLLSMKNAVVLIGQQPARAAAILAAGAANHAYLAKKGSDFQSFRMKMANSLDRLNDSAAELSAKVDDPQVAPSLASLSLISSQAVQLASADLYRQALAKQPEFDSAYNATSKRISDDMASYKALTEELDSISVQVNKSGSIIGAESQSSYHVRIAAIRQNLSAPVPISSIPQMKANADAIKSALSAEIAEKAISGTGQQNTVPVQIPAQVQQGIPCLTGLVGLLLLGYAFARRE